MGKNRIFIGLDLVYNYLVEWIFCLKLMLEIRSFGWIKFGFLPYSILSSILAKRSIGNLSLGINWR